MSKNIRRVNPTESAIQQAIVEWARKINFFKNLKIGSFLIKIANEGKRSWETGKKIKKEGLTRGVSDLFLAIPKVFPHVKNGLWIEVKSKNGKLSKSQNDWQILVMGIGYHACVVRSVDEGIQAIKDYLGMR